jgi:class 3 adenylate cyclase/tetratricopeptide (TPR) repeat protein
VRCGAALAVRCARCGNAGGADDRFCAACGSPLGGGVPAPLGTASQSATEGSEPVSERRLVTVLFADLVGFTTLSERRDPEEVRELLGRYFEQCRVLIERYGGTVGKFIGDAVMAVWGTPVAREDDAERAVRAALALIQAVALLGEEVGMPDLRVRAGVLTGHAAVDVGAEREGMVLGDTVNTASRLQSIAAPGTVLVDDVTHRASEAAIAYEDGGTHQVKGREQLVHAWTALRVVAGAGGARRSAGLEPPFVGRDTELQAIVSAADRSAGERCARHIAVVGEAGFGKSRLVWEFFKYLDGIEEARYWHHGRSLSYGEGVAYWALAEMVRSRAGILEKENPAAAREKLTAVVEKFVRDDRDRRLVEPRLAHLLRLEERPDADRADLFSGWRLFFERLSEDAPVILVFEDLQWAESGLLEFIDYLLEWSADFPIFVLTLARPELRERRPSWQPLQLEPLETATIATMLEGLAPGLPDELAAQICRRAEGIPLYAVETIRMLEDRGVLTEEGARYVVSGKVSDLDVPETLQALVASRLDGLAVEERSLLQDASVLGQSFTVAAAAALSGRPEREVEGVLDGLVTKQVLARDDDPRSPERGQYVFLQALLRTVAYGTLTRRARKSRHIAAARFLEQTWPGEARDIAEVLASHFVEAIRADPEADDAGALRRSARDKLTAAGGAAASLALGPEAQRYFEQAAELAEDDVTRAELFEQMGRALWHSGDARGAEERLRTALELYEANGRAAGPAAVTLSTVLVVAGRLDEARTRLERFRSNDQEGIDQTVRAEALAELGRVLMLRGAVEEAGPLLEEALRTLELNQAWPALTTALINRAIFLIYTHRREEAVGILRHSLSLAEEHALPSIALRARFNLAAASLERDQFSETIEQVNQGLVLARERGDRALERQLLGQMVSPLAALGRWSDAMGVGKTLLDGEDLDSLAAAAFLTPIAAARGDEETLARCRALAVKLGQSTYVDQRVSATLILARDAIEHGACDDALKLTDNVLHERSMGGELAEEGYALRSEAAIALGDDDAIAALVAFVEALPPARATPLLRAGRERLAAEQAHRRGDAHAAETHALNAISLLRSVGARPLLARLLIEHAHRRHDKDALAEARTIYSELGASRWLSRAEALGGVSA